MCWAAKVKTPAVTTPTAVPAPAPLTEAPKGVEFGGDEDSSKGSETSGVKSVTVKPNTEGSNSSETSTNFGAAIPTGSKASSFSASALKGKLGGKK